MILQADRDKQSGGLNPRDRQAVTRFLNTITAERGAAANTIAAYERDLVIWAATLPSGADLLTAGVEDLRRVLGRWSGRSQCANCLKAAECAASVHGFCRCRRPAP